MGQLGTSNLNLNLNLNPGADGTVPASSRARINTQEFRKLVDREIFPFQPGSSDWQARVAATRFRDFWDPERHRWALLRGLTG